MKFKTTLLLFLFSLTVFSQPWMTEKLEHSKEPLTFYDYTDAFNNYWKDKNVKFGYYLEKGERKKAYGWKQFKRWEYFWLNKVNPETGAFPTSEQYQQSYTIFEENYAHEGLNADSNGLWSNLGPMSPVMSHASAGRLNCIAFHPTDPNTFWVGAPTGGLWKTTDGGENWIVFGDNLHGIGVSAIGIPSDYETSQTIYLGTGDRDSWSHNVGNGLLKSTDGGLTWDLLLPFDLHWRNSINKILIDPNNETTIYASSSYGIHKSEDAGESWSIIIESNDIVDLEFKPDDPQIIYACDKTGKIFTLSNGGENYSTVVDLYNSGARRIELTVSAASPELVFAVISNTSSGLLGIYKSEDAGLNYSQIFDSPNILSRDFYGGDNLGQAHFDLCLIADPTNEDILYCGGINTWKSIDGGYNWEINNYSAFGTFENMIEIVHADKHYLEFNNGTLYECNDGGLAKCTDGVNWEPISRGIINSQLYRLAIAQTDSNMMICGHQDNGTKSTDDGINWQSRFAGDGMNCEINPLNSGNVYLSAQYGMLMRSRNNWQEYSFITSDLISHEPINGLTETGGWLTPYIISPHDTNDLYIGLNNVWKSNNQGDLWTKISGFGGSSKLTCLSMAQSNDQVFYTTSGVGIKHTLNGGEIWNEIGANLPTFNITSLTIKNSDPNTAWVTFNNYYLRGVYQTTNRGLTWTNISDSLIHIPCNTLIQNEQNTTEVELYVGTDLGVFLKKGEANWVLFSAGMPKIAITDLEIFYHEDPSQSKIRASSWGRGIWESKVSYTPSVVKFEATETHICVDEEIQLTDFSENEPDSWSWEITPNINFEYLNSTNANSQFPEIKFLDAGIYAVKLTTTKNDETHVLEKLGYLDVAAIPLQPSLIVGIDTICTALNSVYTVNITENTHYNWDIPADWWGISNTNEITLRPDSNSASISVTAENRCGISPENQTKFITVKYRPAEPSDIFGLDTICENGTPIYSTPEIENVSYSWITPYGWIGSSDSSSIYISQLTNSGNIAVRASNMCGGSALKLKYIHVLDTSFQLSPIYGSTYICENSTEMYSIPESEASSCTWTIPENWTGVSTSNTISIIPNHESGVISVNTENICGTSGSQSLNINVIPLPSQPSFIEGEDTVCQFSTHNYSITEIDNLSYSWILPEGWPGASNTNQISITFNDTSNLLSVMAENTCGFGAVQSKNINVQSLPSQPSFIEGEDTICQFSTHSYSITEIDDLNYNWILPEGWSGASSTNQISITSTDTAGILTVTPENSCGFGTPQSKTITLLQFPIPLFSFDMNQSAVQFTNLSENANSYLWDFGDSQNSDEVNPLHVYTANGSYVVSLKAFNDCSQAEHLSDVNIYTIDINNKEESKLKIYPNPSSGILTIENLPKEDFILKVINIEGREIINKLVNNNQSKITVDLSHLSSGMYSMMIFQNNKSELKTIIIE